MIIKLITIIDHIKVCVGFSVLCIVDQSGLNLIFSIFLQMEFITLIDVYFILHMQLYMQLHVYIDQLESKCVCEILIRSPENGVNNLISI